MPIRAELIVTPRRFPLPLAVALAVLGGPLLRAAPGAAQNDGATCEVPAAAVAQKARPGEAIATTDPADEAAAAQIIVATREGTPSPAPTPAAERAQRPALVAISGTPLVVAPRRSPAMATPAGGGAGATPSAPAAPTRPSATPDANAGLAEELTAVARALGACLSDNDAAGVVELATERYLGQLYGGGEPLSYNDYLVVAPQLDRVPTAIRAVEDVQRRGNDRATATVTQVVGNQLLRSRWTFVRQPRRGNPDATPWRVDGEEALEVAAPAGSAEIGVTVSDFAIALDGTGVPAPDVLLRGINAAGQDHELLVLRVDGGQTVQDLLRAVGPALPDGFAYAGQATVPAGGTAELALVGLEAGDYLLVCLFPDERGVPHAALGMAATFTVTGNGDGG